MMCKESESGVPHVMLSTSVDIMLRLGLTRHSAGQYSGNPSSPAPSLHSLQSRHGGSSRTRPRPRCRGPGPGGSRTGRNKHFTFIQGHL